MPDILLTVSGTIPADIREQVAQGRRPRPDYLALADGLPADLLDYSRMRAEGGWSTRLVEKLAGPNAALAWECFRRRDRYRIIFTDGEQIGIPLAVFLKFLRLPFGSKNPKGIGKPSGSGRRPRHAMIVHILSVRQKMIFFDLLGIQSAIDRFLVYSTWQKEFIQSRWNISPDRVAWIPFQADGLFFSPPAQPPSLAGKGGGAGSLCSAGLEFRDYPTLMAAVEGLPVQAILAAASPWSKRGDTTQQRPIPSNVTVRRFSLFEMRELYAQASFVVVPLYPVNFQAGVTTIMEAMAMAKAVIVTRTPGQTDYVVEGRTGLYVPPGDAPALRAAIQRLLDHPAEAEALGRAGRELFAQEFDLDRYIAKISDVLSVLCAKDLL